MSDPLRALIVEDSESDAALVIRQLREAGGDVDARRVETADEMRAALKEGGWDIVIADYRLPQFNAPAALAVLQETGLDLPFLVVSGTVGEDTAVAMMKAGAHDYLMKDHLARLAPAVERELREARTRQERQEAQTALRDSESRFSTIFRVSPMAIALTRLRDGILLDVNEAWTALTGFGRDEVLGRTTATLGMWLQPVQRESFIQSVREQGAAQGLEVELLRKSGEKLSLLMSAEAIELSGERCMLSMAADITDRKWAEEVLRDSEKKHRELVENLNDVIFVVNEAGRFAYVSPAIERVMGRPVADVEGHHYAELVHPDDRDKVSLAMRDAFEGRLYPSEFRFETAPGEYRWVRVSSRPLLEDGQVVGLSGVLTDVSEQRRAEEKAETLTRSIDVHPDGAYWLDIENRFVYVNDAACKVLGYAREQLLRMTVFDVNPDATAEGMQQVWQRLRSEGHFFSESTHRRNDGNVFPVDIATAYVRSGGREYACGFARDITARKLAEDALRKSEGQLSAALKLAHLGHWEYDVATDLFTFNDHFYALMRTTAEREGGYTMTSERYARRFCHPDDMAMVGREIGAALEATDPNYSADLTHRVMFGDGTTGHITVRIFVAKDEQGRTVRTYGVNQDVTERTRGIEALRASEERFRTVFEAVTDGILAANAESGRFVMANQAICRMMGYTEEELLRLAVDDIHPPEDRPMVQEVFKRQLAGERPLATGIPVKRKDGSTFVADIHGLPLTLGDTRCLLGVFRDMTAFNEMEQQLRQAQKMEAIGQLAGGVAHDFNNILCVIQGHCDLVLKNLREDDPFFKSLAQIQSSGQRAAALTRQLLAFSRKQPLQPAVLDLNATVSNLEGMLRRLIGEDVDLVATLDADLGRVKADPGQLEQVIVNLVVNARDAMPQGGELRIKTANVELDEAYASAQPGVAAGPHVMLAVSDTGCGMSEKTQERIFEPFFTTKGPGRGTGLGLSTVYGIVKQSGGHIRVESEVGRGTTFRVYLPRTEEAVALTGAHVEQGPLRGTGERILVVEDEEGLREIVRDILGELGYHATVAANGGEALLIVEEGRLVPDLLITDVVMPGMSGSVLTERLRRTHPDLKVLFMSGYTNDAVVRRGMVQGTPFIQKPFKTEDLAAKVWWALRGDSSKP